MDKWESKSYKNLRLQRWVLRVWHPGGGEVTRSKPEMSASAPPTVEGRQTELGYSGTGWGRLEELCPVDLHKTPPPVCGEGTF